MKKIIGFLIGVFILAFGLSIFYDSSAHSELINSLLSKGIKLKIVETKKEIQIGEYPWEVFVVKENGKEMMYYAQGKGLCLDYSNINEFNTYFNEAKKYEGITYTDLNIYYYKNDPGCKYSISFGKQVAFGSEEEAKNYGVPKIETPKSTGKCNYDECFLDGMYVLYANNKKYPLGCNTPGLPQAKTNCILKIESFYIAPQSSLYSGNMSHTSDYRGGSSDLHCRKLKYGNLTWDLPTKNHLSFIYSQKGLLYEFENNIYWSKTQAFFPECRLTTCWETFDMANGSKSGVIESGWYSDHSVLCVYDSNPSATTIPQALPSSPKTIEVIRFDSPKIKPLTDYAQDSIEVNNDGVFQRFGNYYKVVMIGKKSLTAGEVTNPSKESIRQVMDQVIVKQGKKYFQSVKGYYFYKLD